MIGSKGFAHVCASGIFFEFYGDSVAFSIMAAVFS